MELYATGFNAHTQLFSPSPSSSLCPPPPPKDLLTFHKIASGTSSIRVLCALWSTTVFEIDDQLFLNGFHDTSVYHNQLITGLRARDVKTVFGDAGAGVIGALGWRGELWRVVEVGRDGEKGLGFLEWEGEGGSWLGLDEGEDGSGERRVIEQVAVAENDPNPSSSNSSPSSSFSQTPSTKTLLHTFPSFSALLTSPTPQSTQPLPSSPTAFLASSTAFTSLHPSQILTWGSPLHSHLGRTPTPETPASSPGPVLALGGIPIRKVATRGWMTAALSGDHELYVWGGRAEERTKIAALRMRDGEEVALVDDVGGRGLEAVVDGGGSGGEGGGDVGGDDEGGDEEVEEEEEEGILDVGVGESHILVLTTRGKVYAVGEGKWGQLGTGKRKFEREWVEVQVPVLDGGTGCDGDGGALNDVNDTAVAEREASNRPGWHASEGKSTRDHLGASDRQHQPPRRKIIGVECGFWNSFLLMSVGE